jgi:hypothetical protein
LPTKLDEMIAKVALAAAGADPDRMMAAAAEIAPKITREDAAKLPERWSPKITSKAAGVPHFRDSWPRAWFEALVEILFQKGAIGLPALLELLDREGATYHENVVLRLLRLAASGVERDMILAKLKSRLPALHQTQVYACVREVVFWSERDPMVLELLRPMAELKVKNAEGATVGTYIKQYEAELALVQAKRAPRTSADPLDELIVATAILALEPDAFRAHAAAAAGKLGRSAAEQLLERLPKPDLTTLQSRAPAGLPNCAAAWSRAVIEILSHLGSAALPAAWSILDSGDEYLQEKSLRLLCLLAARETGDRGTVIDQLRKRLPTFHNRELRPVVSDLLVDARRDERVLDVLGALGDVVVKDYGNGTIAVEQIVKVLFVPPKPIRAVNPSHPTAGKVFAERFGAAVVAKDFVTAHGMFCAALRKSITPKKLASLVSTECKHSGPPDAFEYSDNDTTVAELRDGKNEFSPLPDHVTDSNFRRWCCLQFLPLEESDADACFDWWMALIEEKGEWKVGSFHVLDSD